MIRFPCLALLLAVDTFGQAPSPAARAKADFEKVDSAPIPSVRDSLGCVQSHAALLAVTRPEEQYVVHYRKGYCELFAAIVSENSASFQAASKDFLQAIAAWPKKSADKLPSGLRALAAIARLEQGRAADSYPEIVRELETAVATPNCGPNPAMGAGFCLALVDTAKTWLGWFAYRKDDLEQSIRFFDAVKGSIWNLWASGRQAQRENRLPEAVALFDRTFKAWLVATESLNPDVVFLLGPKLDLPSIHFQIARAEYALKRYDSAIANLDVAIKSAPTNSYAIFLRARAKDALHLDPPALADYALAATTARSTNDASWAYGDAYFHRAVILYRRKEYALAENEFTRALEAKVADVVPADLIAWRTLSAVAGGKCKEMGDVLESALRAATAGFPKAEADALLFDCRLKQATTVDQMIALDKAFTPRLTAERKTQLRAVISDKFAEQGIAAEDRKDSYTAVVAYRRAVEWNPRNPKARFNLGAIYIEDKRFDLAEGEYRAMVASDAKDFEAQYWLAVSILAQRPSAERSAEACRFLNQSLLIADQEKKAAFAKTLSSAKCPK